MTPGLPWHTTPTPPRSGAPHPTHTATSRTSGATGGSARPGSGGAQWGHPRRRLVAPPLPPGWRPLADGRAPGCIHPQPPPPKKMGLGTHATPKGSPVYLASVRPPHVPAPTSGGTLLPGVQWCGLMAPRHHVACGCCTLRTGDWVSPHTFLPQGHAARLAHLTRAPPCRPPAFLAQPRLSHGHRPHPC